MQYSIKIINVPNFVRLVVFLNPGPGHPPALHILRVSNQTHLIQPMSSLEETPEREVGVSD